MNIGYSKIGSKIHYDIYLATIGKFTQVEPYATILLKHKFLTKFTRITFIRMDVLKCFKKISSEEEI